MGYLSTELNDLTTNVVWANVPDANITQSSVTQHQGALLITETQITDLRSYVLPSDSINILSDVNTTGVNIGEILSWNGSSWIPTVLSSSAASSGVNGYASYVKETPITTNITGITNMANPHSLANFGNTVNYSNGQFTFLEVGKFKISISGLFRTTDIVTTSSLAPTIYLSYSNDNGINWIPLLGLLFLKSVSETNSIEKNFNTLSSDAILNVEDTNNFKVRVDSINFGNNASCSNFRIDFMNLNPIFDSDPSLTWVNNGTDVNYTGGNVGIGKSNPTSKLDVLGNVKISGDILISGKIGVGTNGEEFGANGNVLISSGSAAAPQWVENNIDNLQDVNVTNVSSGNLLKYSGSEWVNSDITIGDLTDVNTTNPPVDGQILIYNGSTNKWEPGNNSGGGGGGSGTPNYTPMILFCETPADDLTGGNFPTKNIGIDSGYNIIFDNSGGNVTYDPNAPEIFSIVTTGWYRCSAHIQYELLENTRREIRNYFEINGVRMASRGCTYSGSCYLRQEGNNDFGNTAIYNVLYLQSGEVLSIRYESQRAGNAWAAANLGLIKSKQFSYISIEYVGSN